MLKEATRTRARNGVSIEMVTVTPEIAKSWLDKNTSNRKPNSRFVTRFIRDMKRKEWLITGDPIKFDKSGTLIDGQHRLSACVMAETPFDSYVAYGLDENARTVVDTGKARSGSDVLHMNGIKNANQLATALRILINEKSEANYRSPVTNTELLAAFYKHPKMQLWAPYVGAFPNGISVSLVGYVAYVGGHVLGKKDRAAAMVEVLKTGKPDYDGDPIHRYREKIIRSKDDTIGHIRARDSVVWTLKHCWNLFAKRQPVGRLDWLKEDVEIIGLDKAKL